MHRVPLATVFVAVVAIGGLSGACGGGNTTGSGSSGSAAAGCRAPFQERLDPRSTQHLFPGATEPAYLTDPPTSGPHKLGPPPTGVVAAPISRPVQVAMLELGYVIIQYRPGAPGGGAGAGAGAGGGPPAAVAALAGNLVTVAPGPATPPLPAPVVATAWTWKIECGSQVDAAALQSFIAAHKGKGFSHPSASTTVAP